MSGEQAVERPDTAAAAGEPALIRFVALRVWGHLLFAAAFLGAVWAVVAYFAEVDLVAAAALSLLVLAFDGYGTICRALRHGPIATLSRAGIAVHLPGTDPIPWSRIRSARVGGNFITGRYLEIRHEGPMPSFGLGERLGFGITAKRAGDGVRLVIGCLEQSNLSLEEIEASLVRNMPALPAPPAP